MSTTTSTTGTGTGKAKIYIIFYSTWGHIYRMAQEVAKGKLVKRQIETETETGEREMDRIHNGCMHYIVE
jgi:hypothetical protein